MIADAFVAASRIVADLVDHPEVARRWDEESACAGMTVGGLATHLVGQAVSTARLVPAGPGLEPPIPLLEHYVRARWVRAGLDEEANVSIRESGNAEASVGVAMIRERVAAALEELPSVLAGPERGVYVPWQGWTLSREDWLVSRLMETVVHTDDLAASIGVTTPEFPDEAFGPVLELLTTLAVRRHGQTAVLRTLARSQRAPESVTAF